MVKRSTAKHTEPENSIEITDIVGTYEKVSNYGFVRPDVVRLGSDVYIPSGRDLHALNGQKVCVHIDKQGIYGRKPQGTVTEILGLATDPHMDILTVTRALGIISEFPEDVLAIAERLDQPISQEEIDRRMDLREIPMVTIDGEDSKDFDDAVSLYMEGDCYKLGVHIADVSHYVTEGSPLDQEALRRGTSVYLCDTVIPMLPFALSNGICSLNEGEDRLALSCLMTIDRQGKLVDHEICETVIRSDRRMTYHTVNDIIYFHDPQQTEAYGPLSDMFLTMYELSQILRGARAKRGSIDFDLPESKVLLAPDGSVEDILPYERNAATMLIEDFMLMANETVAQEYYDRGLPFVYRIHEKPSPEKMNDLSHLIRQLGYNLKGSIYDIHPKEIQKLLESIAGTENEDIIARIALRSMQQARYSTEAAGHFGLASEHYCHFTSPIRRYPDLLVHRIIKECLHHEMDEARIAHYEAILDDYARQTSALERRSVDAERAVLKRKKAQYMAQHLGEYATGIISGVTSYGLYVELKNTCEGLIPLRSMTDDYYEYDSNQYLIYGTRHGREYRLGDPITIIIDHVDTDQGLVDFLPARKHAKRQSQSQKHAAAHKINRKNHRRHGRSKSI